MGEFVFMYRTKPASLSAAVNSIVSAPSVSAFSDHGTFAVVRPTSW